MQLIINLASNALNSAMNSASSTASQLASAFSNPFSSITPPKISPPIPKADTGSSRGIGSQPTSPEDIAPSLSLNAGLGGTYKYGLAESANNYSISDPAPNQNINNRGPGINFF